MATSGWSRRSASAARMPSSVWVGGCGRPRRVSAVRLGARRPLACDLGRRKDLEGGRSVRTGNADSVHRARGGAARAWRGQLDFFESRHCTIAWDMPGYGGSAPLAVVNIGSLAAALQDFLQQVGATKPILVGHSIGGMIVQQLLAKSPDIASALVLAQTSPAFGRPDGDWQKSFLEARLGPLVRGETMVSLAPTLVKELVGVSPDERCVLIPVTVTPGGRPVSSCRSRRQEEQA